MGDFSYQAQMVAQHPIPTVKKVKVWDLETGEVCQSLHCYLEGSDRGDVGCTLPETNS